MERSAGDPPAFLRKRLHLISGRVARAPFYPASITVDAVPFSLRVTSTR